MSSTNHQNARLSLRQERFVIAYLGEANGNATEAARMAGYAGKENSLAERGHELLRNPKIAARVNSKLKAEGVTAEFVIRELVAIAGQDARRFFDADGQLIPVNKLGDAEAACISGIEVEELCEGRGSERANVGRIRKIKRWDKVKALELLGKYLALFTDRVAVEGDAGPLVLVLPPQPKPGG